MTDASNSFIRFYPNVLPGELCDEIIDRFDADSRKGPGLVGEQRNPVVSPNIKNTSDLDITLCAHNGDEDWGRIQERISHILNVEILRYGADITSLQQITCDFGLTDYQVQRYEPNEGIFSQHIDRAHPNTAHREVALVIYLNDVEEGGETRFPYQVIQVKPQKGGMVMFPSGFTHPHEGLVPKSGPKYIISCFLCYLEEAQVSRVIPRPT